MPDQPDIGPNEKFALVGFHTIRSADSLSSPISLGPGIWACGRPPFVLSESWKQSLGEVRNILFDQCNVFLLAKMPSSRVENLDGENEKLKSTVYRLFETTLLTGSVRVFDTLFLVTGSHREYGPDARQLVEPPAPLSTPGAPADEVTPDMLREAASFVSSIGELEAMGGFARIGRIYRIHQRALQNPEPMESLHQFCRCVEGFILPDIARTTRQFRSRTELFVGPTFHRLMGQLYQMRSCVEHLRNIEAEDWPKDERERRMCVLRERSFIEELSRCCIARFLASRDVWPHFRDEEALRKFWQTENTQLRASIWGRPFDVKRLRARFRISDADPGP
jgi:hypothetical protein